MQVLGEICILLFFQNQNMNSKSSGLWRNATNLYFKTDQLYFIHATKYWCDLVANYDKNIVLLDKCQWKCDKCRWKWLIHIFFNRKSLDFSHRWESLASTKSRRWAKLIIDFVYFGQKYGNIFDFGRKHWIVGVCGYKTIWVLVLICWKMKG